MTFLTDELLRGLDWRSLERGVARLLGHCGWTNVSLVGGSGDRGGDILATRWMTDKPASWVVQVKAISGGGYVGTEALNEVLHAQAAYGTRVAVLATNGDFTRSVADRCSKLVSEGFDVKLWNGAFLKDLLARWSSDGSQKRQPRPYQSAIIDHAVDRFMAGDRRIQYILATGLGKTMVAAEICAHLWAQGNRHILVLSHSQELALQLEQAFWPQLGKEIPTHVFFDGSPPLLRDGVNFGLYQSLLSYASTIEQQFFDVVVVDEAHHAMAHGFRSCLRSLSPRFLVGMTATPWRGDGQSTDEVFGEPIARVSLVDGMNMGYLAQVDYRLYCDNIDWSAVHELSRQRLSIRDLNKRLFLPERDEAIAREVVRQASQLPRAPRVAIFCPSILHAEKFARFLTAEGLPTVNLSISDRFERHRRLLAFGDGRVSAVTAVDVLNEGVDVPEVNMVVFLRSTHSRRIFVQQLGRGLRIAPDKTSVVVLDFVADVRRMADVAQIGHELSARKATPEIVYLGGGNVAFSDSRAVKFIDAWMADVADLGATGDNERLVFPDLLPEA